MSIIKMSQQAYTEFNKFLDEKEITNKTIRIYLADMGCSGPQFNIAIDDKNLGDISAEINDITFIIEGNLFRQFKGFEIECPVENGTDSFTIEPFEKAENPCSSCNHCS